MHAAVFDLLVTDPDERRECMDWVDRATGARPVVRAGLLGEGRVAFDVPLFADGRGTPYWQDEKWRAILCVRLYTSEAPPPVLLQALWRARESMTTGQIALQ